MDTFLEPIPGHGTIHQGLVEGLRTCVHLYNLHPLIADYSPEFTLTERIMVLSACLCALQITMLW